MIIFFLQCASRDSSIKRHSYNYLWAQTDIKDFLKVNSCLQISLQCLQGKIIPWIGLGDISTGSFGFQSTGKGLNQVSEHTFKTKFYLQPIDSLKSDNYAKVKF